MNDQGERSADDTEWFVSLTVGFNTNGHREQVDRTIQRVKAELELFLGRPVQIKRRRVTKLLGD